MNEKKRKITGWRVCFLFFLIVGSDTLFLQKGQRINGWEITQDLWNQEVEGIKFKRYTAYAGILKATVKYQYYIDETGMGDDVLIYFSKDDAKKLPPSLQSEAEGGITLFTSSSTETKTVLALEGIKEGEYGMMQLVISTAVENEEVPAGGTGGCPYTRPAWISPSHVNYIIPAGYYDIQDRLDNTARLQALEQFIQDAPFAVPSSTH